MRHMEAFRKVNSQGEFHQSFKSQSAMEYLMTYGWAILIIAVVLAALFELGVFNPMTFAPKASPGSCQVVRPEGAGTTNFISLEGECNGELPQYVAHALGPISYITVSGPQIPSGIADRTITLWFYKISGENIFAWSSQAISTSQGCGPLNLQGDVFLHFCTAADFNSDLHFNLNTWNFAAVTTYNPNSSNSIITIYINNQNQSEIINSIYQYPTPDSINIFGGDNDGDTIIGNIADVQGYNTSLSQPEIQALYQEGIGGAPIDLQNLAGWWPLNGNANDYSGNGNNGVPTNVIYTTNWYSGYSAP